MQYLLTEEEHDNLTPIKRVERRDQSLEVARQLIIELAGIECYKGYCDSCPISSIGHGAKVVNRDDSKLICKKTRKYSK